MKEISIENLAYHLKLASSRDLPKPIFFLGAGASISGKIPLAKDIEKLIEVKFENNPDICTLSESDKTYSKLMDCLNPIQRNELLDELIAAAKINVTHIYLAQLIKNNLVDYVLTTNFDNLMLRALALFDIFPPVHDLTSISDFTTTTIKDKSVVYLHGQHNGPWLLNTNEEMTRVKSIVPRIFDTIKNKRPWIFLGYSGNDPIFEHIKNLGRFDNGLYWVGHNDYLPNEEVQNFLNKPNKNTHFIKGYDSDAFMLKLNQELGLQQPDILDKPFSSLKSMLSNIVDIHDKEHFRGAKVRLEIARKNVDYSIRFFEYMEEFRVNEKDQLIDKLKKNIIDLILSEQYDESEISLIKSLAKKYDNQGINDLLAELFFYIGNKHTELLEQSNVNDREDLLNLSIRNYRESIEYMSNSSQSLYNCGVGLSTLASIKKAGTEAELLYEQAIEMYNQALESDPEKNKALSSLGATLIALSILKTGLEADALCEKGFEKYHQAAQANPTKTHLFTSWGLSLSKLADSKTGFKAESLYEEAIEKYRQADQAYPNDSGILNNWGIALTKLAKFKREKDAELLYKQAIEKYRQSIKLSSKNYSTMYNLSSSLLKLADIVTGEIVDKLYAETFKNFQQIMDGDTGTIDVFSKWAAGLYKQASLKTGKEAETLYEKSIEKCSQGHKAHHNNLSILNTWGLALAKLAEFRRDKEAEALYKESIEKYREANEVKPSTNSNVLNNWGISLSKLGHFKTRKEAEALYRQAIEKYREANEVKPNTNSNVLNNWAKGLIRLAVLIEDRKRLESSTLYEQAIEKYTQADKLVPSNYEDLSDWGQILLVTGKNKRGEQAKKTYLEAYEKLEKVYAYNGKCYNLACCSAQLRQTEKAMKYLKKSLENNEVTVEHVLKDDDWNKYLKDSVFKELTKKSRAQERSQGDSHFLDTIENDGE